MKPFLLTPLIAVFLIFVMISAVAAFSQEPAGVPLPEVDKYKWEAIDAQTSAANAQVSFETLRMETVIRQFIEGNPQVKAFNDATNKAIADRDALTLKRDALKHALFENAKLSESEYEIKDGAFAPIAKAAAKQ